MNSEKKKVLFLIKCDGYGVGGHFHSLNHISSILAEKFDIKILSLGSSESRTLKANPFYLGNVLISVLKISNEIKAKCFGFKPDIIHCFDTESLNLAMILPVFWSKKIVYTKCGGPNPQKKYWQISDDIVLFSQENYEWFKRNPYYKKSRIHLLPNRVAKVKLLEKKERIYIKKEGIFSFVRIARIGERYRNSILESFALTELFQKKFKVQLLIIGKIEDESIFKELFSIASKRKINVNFITKEKDVTNASGLLYLADCVIGTGRGLMEAMSLGIPCLTPVKNEMYPYLVDDSNFSNFAATNFSPRNEKGSGNGFSNLRKVYCMIKYEQDFELNRKLTKNLFDSYLGPKTICEDYMNIYLQPRTYSRMFLILGNLPYILKQTLVR